MMFNDTISDNSTLQNDWHSDSFISHIIYSEVFRLIVATLWVLFAVFGVLGNGLVIYIALRYRKLSDITNCYIFNLAITDCLFVLFCEPFTIFNYMSNHWIFGNIICKLFLFFSRASVQATCLTLTVMTIHRCNLIIKSKVVSQNLSKIKRQQKIVLINTCCIWLVSCLISSPDFIYSTVLETEYNSIACLTKVNTLKWLKYTRIIDFITAYTLPLIIITLSYARLLKHLVSNQKRLAKFDKKEAKQDKHDKQDNCTKPLVRKSNQTTCNARAKTTKVTKMVAVVTLNFAVCWFPTHLFVFIRFFGNINEEPGIHWLYLLKTFAHTLTYLTPVVNPCLYAFYNENFRQPLLQIFKPIFTKFNRKNNNNDQNKN